MLKADRRYREIASGRFGARSMRTCLEHANTTRLQHKRVATVIILNSVLLSANANGALLLTWLLDTSNLPGRFRLLATRLAPHLAQLCPHKVASTTILKLINQKVDPGTSLLLLDALFRATDDSILEDILAEQVHGSSFASVAPVRISLHSLVMILQMYKLFSSVHIDRATKDLAIRKVRAVLEAKPPHHSPAYAKLCNEVGLPAPIPQHPPQQVHTPPAVKYGKQNGQHVASGPPHPYANHVVSPAFNFPAFGSPLSPQLKHVQHNSSPSPGPGYIPRQASPYQPMFAMGGPHSAAAFYYGQQYSPYGAAFAMPLSAGSHDRPLPGASMRAQEEYMRSIAAMQST